jgi:hypothetical protein
MKQTPAQAKRLGWLDAMRGTAAPAMVYQHYFGSGLTLRGWNMPRRFLWGALDPARFGVVFFCHIRIYYHLHHLQPGERRGEPHARFGFHYTSPVPVASFAVYRLVERLFIVWGHRIVSRAMARRANAIGSA